MSLVIEILLKEKFIVGLSGAWAVQVLGGPFEVPWRHNLGGSINAVSSVGKLDGGDGNCAGNL